MKNARSYSLLQRLGALCLAVLMVLTIMPTGAVAAGTTTGVVGEVTTVADPDTVSRPVDVYGDNTENAGKVTVSKSVSDTAIELEYGATSKTFTPAEDNFIVTVSQTAQVLGLASESEAPVDVVFVLDTSSSMDDGRSTNMVTAANNAIRSLMESNDYNRVGVVAFSSNAWSDVNNAAAEQLSALAHYDGDAATNHLRWANINGSTTSGQRNYILGRGTSAGSRYGVDGGTNIHAGVALGANMLMDATNTTLEIDGKQVTRMPFLVVLSDGAPTYSSYRSSTNSNDGVWYDPNMTDERGPGNNFYPGNGFLAALTAAYYKGAITEKYFGANASVDNRCYIYTIGVGLSSLTGNEGALAQITMDPQEYFKAGSTNTYYNGNGNNDFYSYWQNYSNATGNFNVQVNNNSNTQISLTSINATKNYVNGLSSTGAKMYDGGLAYNDDYFSADQTADIEAAFDKALTQIQLKAMSSPTHVNEAYGEDFSGYVTFTDPIGEYMEVKDMYGVLANGYFYQGKTLAQYLENWDGAPAEFKELFTKVLTERCRITGTTVDVEDFIRKASASVNQAYYNSDTDYDNSVVWWGNGFTAEGEEDEQVQYLGFADNDTVEYIEAQKAANTIPAGADYVCRSYYFYGTAGNTVANPNHEYLYFVVRVQRSLTAPYQQTVVISAPASLLSVEKVLITEDADGNHTAAVTEAEPARVVYEVGLRSDINAFNVEQILAEDAAGNAADAVDYIDETAEFDGAAVKTNYDAATDSYTFYTNDWHRDAAESSHERAGTTATFDAAADNSFYTYTEDTPIYIRNSDGTYSLYTGTTKPVGSGYYYARTVYDWSADTTPTDGNTYDAEEKTVYIPVYLPDTTAVKQSGSNWVIAEGAYKASSLTGGEDVYKNEAEGGNKTQTSEVAAHPHRTVSETNSHYTVYLGNNGKLTLKSEDTKSVAINKADGETVIQEADGNVVMVGDTLTYTIRVVNPETTAATATVTDTVPRGTEFVSAENGGVHANGVVTWTDLSVPAATSEMVGETTVSFTVKVTEAALSGTNDVVTIDNTAYVTLNNGFTYTTNTTENPPEGKKVVDSEGNAIEGNVQIPDVLVYRIRWQNDAVDDEGNPVAATVTITDKIPTGTTYQPQYTQPAATGPDAEGVITWVIDAAPGASGVVSFRVNVNAAALEDETGRYVQNNAEIEIENDPNVRVTNTPKVYVDTGDLQISKIVSNADSFGAGIWTGESAKTFTLNLHEIGDDMTGEYDITRQVGQAPATSDSVTFTNGKTQLVIKHNETVTIHGIPAGAIILVTEQETGYTATYKVNGADSAEGRATIVTGDDPASVEVSNEYDPAAVTFTINGSKTLETSMPLGNTTFGFTAQRYIYNEQNAFVPATDEAAANTVTGIATVSSTSKTEAFTFSPITFKEAGTYYYVIEEADGGVTGISYDNAKYKLTISVIDDGSGQLKVDSYGLTKFDAATNDYTIAITDDVAAFTNSYEPKEVQLELTGTKTLSGRPMEEGEFSFTVKEGSTTVSTGYNTDTDDADDLPNNIVFTPITYTHEDMWDAAAQAYVNEKTFTYSVTEDNSGAYGVTYTTWRYELTVKVTDVDGQLNAEITGWKKYVTANGLETELDVNTSDPTELLKFANVFDPEDVGLTLYGTKTLLDGNDNDISSTLTDQQFAFEIEELTSGTVEDGTWTHVTYGNNTVLDSDSDAEIYDNIVFGTIYYELEDIGTHTYRIHEIIPEGPSRDPNMDYADNYVYVDVVVSLDADNKLVATATTRGQTAPNSKDNADIAFTNVKYPNTISVKPQAFKTTYSGESGTEQNVPNVNFSFVVIDKDTGEQVTTGVGSANHSDTTPNVTFDDIVYGNDDLGADGTSKTYTYIIKEAHSGTAHGIQHDPAQYVMQVTLSRTEAGELTKDVKYYTYNAETQVIGDEITGTYPSFTNRYNASAYVNVTAQKLLKKGEETIPFDGKTFAFEMQRVTDATGATVHATDDDIIEGVSNAQNVTFGTLYYDQDDVAPGKTEQRYYKITEVKTDSTTYPGVTYDNTKYVIEVTIVHAATEEGGSMTAEITAIYKDGTLVDQKTETEDVDLSNIVFSNQYTTQTGTSVEFTATKELTGRSVRAGEFQFGLYYNGALVDTAYNSDRDGDGNATDVYFYREYEATTAPGTYNYQIKEIPGDLSGVDYDEVTVGEVSVTIAENTANATLYVSAKTNPTIKFTNTYEPLGATLPLSGTKTLENRDAIEGEFGFEVLKKVTENGQEVWKPVGSGRNTDTDDADTLNNNIVFTNLNFTPADMWNGTTYVAEKEFVFRVREVQGSAPGVAYSQDYYELTVKVTTNEDAELVPTVTEMKLYRLNSEGTYEAVNATSLDFKNTYTPEDISVAFAANKTLNGRDMTAGEFSFVVREGINQPNGTVKATGSNAGAADGVSVAVQFSNIGYSIADMEDGQNVAESKDFYYTIYEEHTGQSGVTFSAAKYVKVTVLYDSGKGVLSIGSVEYYNKAEGGELTDKLGANAVPAFVNTYSPTSTSLKLDAGKTLINKKLEAGEFNFILKNAAGETLQSKSNNGEGAVTFDLITYTSADMDGATEKTFEYTVSEAVANADKADLYTLDNDVKVIVTVKDDQKGKLHATVQYSDGSENVGGVEFINYYRAPGLPADLNAEIGATKTMDSPVDYSTAGFRFVLTDVTGAPVKGRDANGNVKDITGVSEADGDIVFSPNFYFEKAGEYHYWISEEDPAKPGVQMDETAWEVHILVRYNDGTATDENGMPIEVTDYKGDIVNAGELYIGAGDVQIYKTGRAADDSIGSPVFVNTYTPAGTTLHLTAKKVLNGRALKDREFAFYLMDGDLIAAEGYNDVNGNIKFTMNYTAADIGIHSYTIVERQGSVPGVTYDTKEYAAVTVEVKDDQETGKLVAYVGGKAQENDATVDTGVTLTNDYIAADTVAVVKANKVLTGKGLKTGEFSFQLVNTADAEEVYTASNAADGSITFQIGCEKAGVTTYELREVKGTVANMTYDSSVYKVTVTVTDDGLGNLPVQVTYDTENGEAPTFHNTYKPEAVAVKLSGSKVLNGRDMTAGEFKFEVRDSSGTLVSYAFNDAKGVLSFTEIELSTPGTYTLTVSEVAGNAANVTYDDAKLKVVVEVTNEDGVLAADVTYPAGGLKFVNQYEKPADPTTAPTNPVVPDTGDHSNVTLYMVLAVVSVGACLILFLIFQKNKKRK